MAIVYRQPRHSISAGPAREVRRSRGRSGLLALSALAMIVTGCAQNTLQVEGAAKVGTAAKAFTDSANTALEDAKARRVEANATLIASDSSCEPLTTVSIYVRRADAPANTPVAPLCAGDRTPRPGYDIEQISLKPFPAASLKPTLLLIGAVGDYGAALAKVAERPDTDIGKELASLAAKASEAESLANSILGTNLPDAEKLLATDQAKAAIALAQFATKLAEEQAKVRDIRKIVDKKGDEVVAQIPELSGQLRKWLLTIAQGDAQIVQNNLMRVYNSQRGQLDYDKRLAMVTLIGKARADAAGYPEKLAALQKGLDAFKSSEADLRRLLSGKFTAKERKRIAELNQQRMFEAIGLMTRAVAAFGGL